MGILRFLAVLAVWVAIAPPVESNAQISSNAFDPNCYQPQLGVDIDTIMGSYNGQMLGGGLINIGPSPDNPGGPGRLMMYGLPGTLGDSSAGLLNVGPNFNYRNLNIFAMLGFKPKNPIPGHYRSMNFTDLLLLPTGNGFSLPRIYWQKQGGFDSSYYTTLLPDERLRHGYAGTFDEINPPYHARLESDTAEDIVMFYTYYPRVISSFFRGGANLFHPGDTISPSDTLLFDTLPNYPSSGYRTFQGDFRGTGREDFVGCVVDTSVNLYVYLNNRPFTLQAFSEALKHDTLFTIRSEPWLRPGDFSPVKAIHLRNNDPESLVIVIDSAAGTTDVGQQLRIYRGGPQFGMRRLSFDSLPTIHAPVFFDGGNFRLSGWGAPIVDCGDMTGTGDHVLYVGGGFAHDAEFYTFYVLGNSFDEKVDMYISQTNDGEGVADTATLDGDRLQDVVIGAPDLPWLTDNGMNARGSLLFVHGTDKIPHNIASVIREEKAHPEHEAEPFSVSQSADGRMILLHAWHGMYQHSTATLHDVLGRVVVTAEESEPLIDWRIPIPDHPSGAYIFTILTENKVFTYKLAMLR